MQGGGGDAPLPVHGLVLVDARGGHRTLPVLHKGETGSIKPLCAFVYVLARIIVERRKLTYR